MLCVLDGAVGFAVELVGAFCFGLCYGLCYEGGRCLMFWYFGGL